MAKLLASSGTVDDALTFLLEKIDSKIALTYSSSTDSRSYIMTDLSTGNPTLIQNDMVNLLASADTIHDVVNFLLESIDNSISAKISY